MPRTNSPETMAVVTLEEPVVFRRIFTRGLGELIRLSTAGMHIYYCVSIQMACNPGRKKAPYTGGYNHDETEHDVCDNGIENSLRYGFFGIAGLFAHMYDTLERCPDRYLVPKRHGRVSAHWITHKRKGRCLTMRQCWMRCSSYPSRMTCSSGRRRRWCFEAT